MASASEMIEVLSVNERPERQISMKALAEVVSARYEELFNLVRQELRRSGFENLIAAGIVLTGGSSSVQGAVELAEQCFEVPVRNGCAQHISGLAEANSNPSLATGVGLLLHGLQQQYEGSYNGPVMMDSASNVWTRMKNWFHGNF